MPRRCSICDHDQRPDIDAALVGGAGLRAIARQFQVGRDALRRHRANGHLTDMLLLATEAEAVARGDDLLAQVREVRANALRILARAEGANDLRVALLALREIRQTVELLAKLAGELDQGQTVVVVTSPEWLVLRSAIVAALDHHPAARVDVLAALGPGDG